MDNLGAIFGPLLALALVATVGVRWAIGLSIIPGMLAAAAIIYAIRHAPKAEQRDRVPLRIHVRPVLRGDLGRLMGAVACFEVGNVAATLLILRATELLAPGHGTATATTLALALYTLYNLAATVASLPAGRAADRLGPGGPLRVLAAGVALFAAAYTGFSVAEPPSPPGRGQRRAAARCPGGRRGALRVLVTAGLVAALPGAAQLSLPVYLTTTRPITATAAIAMASRPAAMATCSRVTEPASVQARDSRQRSRSRVSAAVR